MDLLGPLGFNSLNIAQRHALHVERTAEKAFEGEKARSRIWAWLFKTCFFRSTAARCRPLGPLGFDFAQHRQALRPSVDRVRSKALRPFGL